MTEETRSDDPGGPVAEKALPLAEGVQEPPTSSAKRTLPPSASAADGPKFDEPPPLANAAKEEAVAVEPPLPEQVNEPEVSASTVPDSEGRSRSKGAIAADDEAEEETSEASLPEPRTPEPAMEPEAVGLDAPVDAEQSDRGGGLDPTPLDAGVEADGEQPEKPLVEARPGQPEEAPAQLASAEAEAAAGAMDEEPVAPKPPINESDVEPEAMPAATPLAASDAMLVPAPDQSWDARPLDAREQLLPAVHRDQDEHGAPQVQPGVPAELIWSGPEESEVAAPAPPALETPAEPDPAAGGATLEPAVWQAAEPQAHEARPSTAASALLAGTAPARSAAPRPDVQPALAASRLGGYLRLGLRLVAMLVVGYAALVLLLTVLYRWIDPPASALMVAQRLSGTAIEQTWVPLNRISPHLVQAVILSEDGAFCRHRGVDWSAVEEAIESTRDGILRGGSTITMQVVKNLFLWNWRSYVRKAIEIPLAYLVELFWPKARVLEIYLNIAEWGDGIFGVEAAARHHFGKSAASLTAQEAALLAVALPNPIERHPGQPGYLVRRLANNLLARMKTVRTTIGCVRRPTLTR